MKPSFSILTREADIKTALSESFDIIIIGGGVTGCGIALDAVARGLKTLLIEKTDFAAGTSSRSTKLIHGGLRYLKQLEIGLVRETGLERAVVHRLAPHLVHAEKMLLPIVDGGTFNKWTASLAISVYDLLAKVEASDRKLSFNKDETMALEPLLRSDILKGGILYSEYRTDDARLTIEIMKKAVSFGAKAFNYMEVCGLSYDDNGKVNGVNCKDLLSHENLHFKSKAVVSAAGPWVDGIRELDGSRTKKSLRLTKGVHIVVPHEKLPITQAVYFDVFDGRMLFAIPRGNTTYIGTTDTDYQGGKLDKVVCELVDANYILAAVNLMFPSAKLQVSDIKSTWAGLRPLIHEDGKSPSEVSRRDEIFLSDSGLISIGGGKLTGYRKMAQRVVEKLSNYLHLRLPRSKTKSISLTENPFLNVQEVKDFINTLSDKVGKEKAWYLTTTYGKAAQYLSNVNAEESLIAELYYTIYQESVANPVDFYLRRTGMSYFNIDEVKASKVRVLSAMSEIFKWTEEQTNSWSDAVDEMIRDVSILA